MQETRTTVSGVEIFARERDGRSTAEGGAAAAPIVYIHGNTGSSRWFERVMEIPGRLVIAPDMPNFGGSGRIDEADIDRYAQFVLDFLEARSLSPAVIVAHSLGGAVAHAIAATRPAAIERLMLVDAAAPTGLVTPEEHYPIIEMFKTNRELLAQGLAGVTPTLNDPAFLDALVDDAMEMNPIAFAGNARALARIDYTAAVGAFAGPVSVVWGTLDAIITREMAEQTVAAYPNAALTVLEGIGHSVMVEAPERFTELVTAFIA